MVKGKEFLVPDGGFFQANLYLTDRLVDEVCRLAMPGKINTLVDAYCGSGLFSIFLSPYAQNVFGIETDEQAVKFAKRNAENQGVRNTKFICGDVENVLPQEFASGADSIDLLVLDPPRSGCDGAVLKAISTLRPQKVIYISCNPATQARDIKYLRECGYDLLSLLPLDMFAQTEHIEVIGYLSLR
jgi:23S rRNA (uracil1939-C5)-methyltransferase